MRLIIETIGKCNERIIATGCMCCQYSLHLYNTLIWIVWTNSGLLSLVDLNVLSKHFFIDAIVLFVDSEAASKIIQTV